MKKVFNITGPCVKNKHYMVNINEKINIIEEMIDRGEYFVINRPRQYGKTTLMYLLEERIKDKYIVINCSFEGLGDILFSDEKIFSSRLLKIFSRAMRFTDVEVSKILNDLNKDITDLDVLSDAITDFIFECNKEVVLFIDEVDKSSNNQLFLSFLGMLRNKFILKGQGRDYSFHSVVLSGVHDIKNLKLMIRDNEEKKYNSPWNIAVNFDIDISFNKLEIETMLVEYSKEENIFMNINEMAEKIYFYTSGYPFLVSKLCMTMDLKFKNCWSIENIDKAVKIILNEKNTLFDSLIKNLENNNKFRELIEKITLLGEEVVYVPSDNLISLGEMYGFLKEDNNKCKIHNRIFEQYIYNHLASAKLLESEEISDYNFREKFLLDNGGLDFENILLSYQRFMREQYSSRDKRFLEHQGRLLFLAFIKPIINGVGFDFKEVQVSQEKRLDVVVTYNNYKYISELKIWRGEQYHEEGIKQLCDYLNIHSKEKGYLIVYNFNKNKEYRSETIFINNKEIFIIYV